MGFVNDGSGDDARRDPTGDPTGDGTRHGPRDVYELDELLGAYALDAVDDDDRRRVDDYLAINPRAAAEVHEHREVATMLAFTGMDAPEGLWDRIAFELDEPAPHPAGELADVLDLGEGRGATPPPAPSVSAPPASEVSSLDAARRRSTGRRRRLAAIGPWVATAAAAAVIAVVAIGIVDRAAAPTDPIAQAFESARNDRDSVLATLTAEGAPTSAEAVIDQDGHGYIDATALPVLPDGKTYQLWGVVADTGDAISLGIFGPNPEIETFTSESEVAVLALTIEDAPGVIADGNQDGWYVGELT